MVTRSIARALVVSLALLTACSEPVGPPTAEPVGVMTSTHLSFDCGAQSSIPAIECDALVALYNTTNGDGWTDNTGWLTAADPCAWFGVTCEGGSGVHVVLTRNQLSGSIPPELGNLTSLRVLSLTGNQLSGSIPPELGNLTSLRDLELSGNQLSGSIPPELGNLTGLRQMFLEVNQLSGQVPLPVAQLGGIIEEIFGGDDFHFCRFDANLGLFMPDNSDYRAADRDSDGVICLLPLGGDTDGDAIPDSQDPDVLAEFLGTIPDAAFKSGDGGHRTAMQAILDEVEALIAAGDDEEAIRKLENLKRRVDGCGATADANDWITDCASQIDVRNWIDTLIVNLGG